MTGSNEIMAESRSLISIKRRVRLVMLLKSAEVAGLAPIRILRLHVFAYLSNVLSPVWSLLPLDGKILKRQGGPFYPELQNDLDRLVGMGVANISNVGYQKDEDHRWRLEGAYSLNSQMADPVLSELDKFDEDRKLFAFITELGHALSALSDAEFDRAVNEDATYSDPLTTNDNVVYFEDKTSRNYSANAAKHFDRVIKSGSLSPGEKLHLYVRQMRLRIND